MKRFFVLLVAALLLAGTLAGCAPKEEVQFAPVEEPIEVEKPVETPEPTPEPTPAPTPEPVALSLTTGLPLEEGKEYRPITVMIENSKSSRPQTGMQEADIVYEASAEGGITRHMCVFNDHYPIVAGPIRSTRAYYLNIQREWDSPMVHYGGPSNSDKPVSYVYSSKYDYIKVRVDGLKGKYGKYFWRSKERKAPNNVYTDLQRIHDELYDYEPAQRQHFQFDANVDYAEGKLFTKVGIPFLSNNMEHTTFTYDSQTGKLMRALNGDPFMIRTVTKDAEGKESTETAQLYTDNLIVQYAKDYQIPNDNKGRRMVDVVGSGKCEFFIGGKHVTGKWERTDLDSSTVYMLEDGTPITLRPGKTWIALQSDKKTIEVTYA